MGVVVAAAGRGPTRHAAATRAPTSRKRIEEHSHIWTKRPEATPAGHRRRHRAVHGIRAPPDSLNPPALLAPSGPGHNERRLHDSAELRAASRWRNRGLPWVSRNHASAGVDDAS